MIKAIVLFGRVSELMLAVIYRQLAAQYGETSEAYRVLNRLAAAERRHASVFDAIQPEVSAMDDVDSKVFRRVLEKQGEFMTTLLEIQEDMLDATMPPENLIDRLAALEGMLAENLFDNLRSMTHPDRHSYLRVLADDSAEHARMLHDLLAKLNA